MVPLSLKSQTERQFRDPVLNQAIAFKQTFKEPTSFVGQYACFRGREPPSLMINYSALRSGPQGPVETHERCNPVTEPEWLAEQLVASQVGTLCNSRIEVWLQPRLRLVSG
ncbi:hypothetical protein CISG_08853 [Coccidioides immitis RMSCC 3703]|uniref:Uncharacterized protein n=1 Tax=Coccidioides immitis RMSCC 3703 TaxID=454286 RepID=A0A0J8R7L5_COCIT|nr:hypothetical protein CISG_08853 [Coccidioides immitis RMSCC 3703]